jgi:hypothetical protein
MQKLHAHACAFDVELARQSVEQRVELLPVRRAPAQNRPTFPTM